MLDTISKIPTRELERCLRQARIFGRMIELRGHGIIFYGSKGGGYRGHFLMQMRAFAIAHKYEEDNG